MTGDSALARAVLALALILAPGIAAGGPSPLAWWPLDRGAGDATATGAAELGEGSIHGARWRRDARGAALQFDGVDDWVDLVAADALALRESLSLEAWIRPEATATDEPLIFGVDPAVYALTHYRGGVWFYIGGGGNNVGHGVEAGLWQHVVGVYDGAELRLYIDGELVRTSPSTAALGDLDGRVAVAGGPAARGWFAGQIAGVALWDVALTARDVQSRFNAGAEARGRAPIDASRFGHLGVEVFRYRRPARIVGRVDLNWIDPPPPGASLVVELLDRAGESRQVLPLDLDPPDGFVDARFHGVGAGELQLRAKLVDASGATIHAARASSPGPPPVTVPEPASWVAPPLPPPPRRPEWRAAVDDRGRLELVIDGEPFALGASFSHPGGGENHLGPEVARSEPGWRPLVRRTPAGYQVSAQGSWYQLERSITVEPGRVVVQDTLRNRTAELVGVIAQNWARPLAGDAEVSRPGNGTVLVQRSGVGVGLVPLDDLYQLRGETGRRGDRGLLLDRHIGIAAGGAHSMRWVLYPTGAGYYDVINRLRRDEGLRGRVDGAFGFARSYEIVSPAERWRKGLRYLSQPALARVTTDPTVSLEGWEFVEYPRVVARLRGWMDRSRRVHRDLALTFHVAPNLYATDRPEQLFPDSVVLGPAGEMRHYGPDTAEYYGRYFDPELVRDGWRWWLFYPTLDNEFGRYTLSAVDVMLDEIGADALWADGWMTGYVPGGFSYDRWDGNSVSIDSETGRVTARKAHVGYLSLPVLREIARRFARRGGVVIANGRPGPRSFWSEPVITATETSGGDQLPIAALHLGQTVVALGDPVAMRSERELWLDILGKLRHGALYFWFGERDLVQELSLVARMYPITFASIWPGEVRGPDRIVTANAGSYGWPGSRSLHAVEPFDGRGGAVASRAITTVSADGVRTRVDLGADEAAVIRRIPAELRAERDVNLVVHRYDSGGFATTLHGDGSAQLWLGDGELGLAAGVAIDVWMCDDGRRLTVGEGGLELDFELAGETTLTVAPAGLTGRSGGEYKPWYLSPTPTSSTRASGGTSRPSPAPRP